MKIELGENSKWGGFIPDILRNKKIILKFSDIKITFTKEEYESLKNLLNRTAYSLWEDAEEIVKEQDKRSKAMRDFYDKAEQITREGDFELVHVLKTHFEDE